MGHKIPSPELYSEALFSLDHGFPLFRPAPPLIKKLRGNVTQKDEVQIGSVGYVTKEGSFRTIGNIDSSIYDIENADLYVLPNLYLGASMARPALYNTTGYRNKFSIGLNTGELVSTVLSIGAGFSIELGRASIKGRFLTLPDGAYLQRLDDGNLLGERLRNEDSRMKLISWLEDLERKKGAGPLTIVTGHVKGVSWGTAAIYNHDTSFSGQLTFSALGAEASLGASISPSQPTSSVRSDAGPFEEGEVASVELPAPPNYSWSCSQSTTMVNAAGRSEGDTKDQCLFVQGFRVSRKQNLLGFTSKQDVSVDAINDDSRGYQDLTPKSRSSRTGGSSTTGSGPCQPANHGATSREHRATQGVDSLQNAPSSTTTMDRNDSSSAYRPDLRRSNALGEAYPAGGAPADDQQDKSSPEIEITFYQNENNQICHPLDAVNEYILSKNPDAELAITHDSVLKDLHQYGCSQAAEGVLCAFDTSVLLEYFDSVYEVDVVSGLAFVRPVRRDQPATKVEGDALTKEPNTLSDIPGQLDRPASELSAEMHKLGKNLEGALLSNAGPLSKHAPAPRCPLPSPNYVGREQEEENMWEFFFGPGVRPDELRIYVVVGIGGCGKTQLCRKFTKRVYDKFSKKNQARLVFYVDGTTKATLEASFVSIAKAHGLAESSEAALAWMSTLDQEFFLYIDNADDPWINLQLYFSNSNHAHVLITTR